MSIRSVYVVDGARSPFLKSKNRPGPFAAGDLAVQAGRALLVRQKFAPQDLDEVILGCAAPSVDEVNIGRVAALRMGCGEKVPGWTVMRNCASGMQALDSGVNNILAGRSQLVLAGGVDALSRAPLLYNDKMVSWFSDMAAATVKAVERRPSREAIIVCDDAPVRWGELFGFVAMAAGASPPEMGGRAGFPSFRTSNAKAKRLLGWAPHYADYRMGLVR